MAEQMQSHSRKDIQYEVVRTEVISGQEVRLFLDILPTRFAPAVTDAQMRRCGIVHPARSRATTAALLWLGTLYDKEAGPLANAWVSFCGSRQTPMPFTLFTYDVHVTPPPIKNVTMSTVLDTPSKYDGTTQTATRV
jgi:hypothetical protein